MPKAMDLVGQTFGRLTVIERASDYVSPSGARHIQWLCQCGCGREHVTATARLRSGAAQSCGCLSAHAAAARKATHNASRTAEYNIWNAIKGRCYNPKVRAWRNYGGRGIVVCDRWRHDFTAFIADMGPRPSPEHSVERLDGDKGYEPDNCVWATAKVQARNMRVNRILAFAGRSMCAAAWAEVTGISSHVIRQRIDRQGWSVERALTTPVAK